MLDRENDVIEWMTAFWTSPANGENSYSSGGLGLSTNPGIEEFWRTQYKAFRSETRLQRGTAYPPISIVPAPTGCGKSVLLRVFCAFHGAESRLLIGHRQKSECDLFVSDTREVARRLRDDGLVDEVPFVAAWHSDEQPDEALSADVLVVTHMAMQLAAVQDWRLDLLHRGTRRTDLGTPRPFPDDVHLGGARRWIIDEAMSLVKAESLTVERLRGATEFLRVQLRGNESLAQELSSVDVELALNELDKLTGLCTWADGIQKNTKLAIQSYPIEIPNLISLLGRQRIERFLVSFGISAAETRNQLAETFKLAVSVSNRGLFAGRYHGKTHLFAAGPVLAVEAASLVMLDATAAELPSWEYLASKNMPVRVWHPPHDSPAPRRYENLRIVPFIVRHEAGRSLTKKHLNKDTAFLTEALNELQNQSGLHGTTEASPLVMTHKALADAIQRDNPRLQTAWFGRHDRGSNKFSGYSSMLILGAYRVPMGISQAEAQALRTLAGASADIDGGPDLAQQLNDAVPLSSMIQAINRTRSRQVTDESGGCAPTTVLIAVREGTWGKLRPGLERAMPGVDIRRPVLSTEVGQQYSTRLTKAVLLDKVRAVLEAYDPAKHRYQLDLSELIGFAIGKSGNQHQRKHVIESLENPGSVLFPIYRNRGLSVTGIGVGKSPAIRFPGQPGDE